jgi:CRISPR-associated protein Cas2
MPAAVARTRVVAYDVCDNRRRRQVAKTLEDYGIRGQKSVFLCRLPDPLFERLWNELNAIVDTDEDSVLAFTICGRCAPRGRVLGTPIRPEPEGDAYVV